MPTRTTDTASLNFAIARHKFVCRQLTVLRARTQRVFRFQRTTHHGLRFTCANKERAVGAV